MSILRLPTHRRVAFFPTGCFVSTTLRCSAILLGEVAEHLPKHAQVDTASTCSSKCPGLV